jgi:hypothetical protein
LDLLEDRLAIVIQNRDRLGLALDRARGRAGLLDRGLQGVFTPETIPGRVQSLGLKRGLDRLPRIADVKPGRVALALE